MKSGETKDQLRLMAHLMRRAGFTATRNELEAYVQQGYEQTVEKLLHPQISNHMPDDIIRRYHVGQHWIPNQLYFYLQTAVSHPANQ